jgi:PHD/YefM family antitoxin component YafN of YafNO toxin-antitoxin module
MLKIKPEYLSKRGRREFVILTVEDFNRMQAAIEDADDLRILRRATRKNGKTPYYSSEEVDRRLGTRSTMKRKAG